MELVIVNDLTELRNMSQWLAAALNDSNLTHKQRFIFDLCANEAVTNIMSYAYTDQNKHAIVLRLSLDAQRASLTIEDDGIAFNLLEAKTFHASQDIETTEVGGCGIHLIKNLMDEIHYQRLKDKNILVLVIFT